MCFVNEIVNQKGAPLFGPCKEIDIVFKNGMSEGHVKHTLDLAFQMVTKLDYWSWEHRQPKWSKVEMPNHFKAYVAIWQVRIFNILCQISYLGMFSI